MPLRVAACTAGNSSEIKTAIIAITTNNSIKVNPLRLIDISSSFEKRKTAPGIMEESRGRGETVRPPSDRAFCAEGREKGITVQWMRKPESRRVQFALQSQEAWPSVTPLSEDLQRHPNTRPARLGMEYHSRAFRVVTLSFADRSAVFKLNPPKISHQAIVARCQCEAFHIFSHHSAPVRRVQLTRMTPNRTDAARDRRLIGFRS